MGRVYLDPLLSFCINPAAKDAADRKREGVRAIIVDNRDFKVAVEWSGRYRFPVHIEIIWTGKAGALI